MYSCYASNFRYFYNDVKNSLEDAIAYGRSKGFEFSVWCDGKLVGFCSGVNLSWSPYRG